jgi:hypothetical protein
MDPDLDRSTRARALLYARAYPDANGRFGLKADVASALEVKNTA